MIDRFDNMNNPSEMWERILGGALDTGCGVLGTGNSMYFSGGGTREVRTVALNTTNIRCVSDMYRVFIGCVPDVCSVSIERESYVSVVCMISVKYMCVRCASEVWHVC